MNKSLILAELEQMNQKLYEYSKTHPQHENSIDFLRTKFSRLKHALVNDMEDLQEDINWILLFAPRVVFEGINDRDILLSVEKIRKLL